ncbi:7-cyano-7-deazaguanine synthase [Phaeobacter inhibens]|uniref:7-cyano-7-deazaguanine synthase n=1 Tax=Phaeobacter inhibens TaxID=221822 RepID=UPI0021A30C59|nr:7-cyano-7-deazaguanine synthase [Phaeobacter inhibens]UWR74703.1 7-cyano-7-deazaguanine synthase [Phaeobacter inhibens]UWR98570.1 7-cyano-7-deazaguanine synthase [Phaeobacter inhibens]UWS02474.1 7-cyano-7-deazaguanine synthase [Phaeobacter inhibens]
MIPNHRTVQVEKPKLKSAKLILLSGGLDSAVLAYKLADEGHNVRALYVDFGGDRVIPELTSAKSIARRLDIPLEVAKIPSLRELFIGYVPAGIVTLDGGDSKWCPTGDFTAPDLDTWEKEKAPTALPILCNIAQYYAHIANLSDINMAIIKEQLASYPKISSFLENLSIADSHINETSNRIPFNTPFIGHSKTDVTKLGVRLGVPLQVTWSCVRRGDIHCGECHRCIERQEGFQKAGVADPTKYSSE